MEALGFIESPTTVSNTWSAAQPLARAQTAVEARPIKRGAHERTVADLEPNDTTELLVRSNVRWGLVGVVVLILAGLVGAATWLWQRPIAQAESAVAELESAAADLQSDLTSLAESTPSLTVAQTDPADLATRARAVDDSARRLFNAAGALAASAGDMRSHAADAASSALDASRLLSDAIAYRSAVVQILVPPELETDPEIVALDDAVRAFGTWQQEFNRIRSALPTGTMSDVSSQLTLLAGDLESIQSRYVDGLREDDGEAAEAALKQVAGRLAGAESSLWTSLAEVELKADTLIETSISGLERLLG